MRTDFALNEGRILPCEPESARIINFSNPDEAEKAWLVNECGISAHTISSALDPDELGRFEFEDDHASIILKIPKNYSSEDNFLFRVISMGIFLYEGKLIILSPREESPFYDVSHGSRLFTVADVFLKVIAGAISHFLGHLKVINMLSDALEQKVNTSMANEHLLSMFTIEKSLVYYLNGINSNAVVMEKIRLNSKRIGFKEEQQEYLDDIIIDNSQCNKQAEIYSDILTGLMDARGSIVNNNLNILIKRLTIISVVFMPLNLIASMGGMSEYTVMTGNAPYWISYGLFTIGITIVGWLTYVIVKKYSGDDSKSSLRATFQFLRKKRRLK